MLAQARSLLSYSAPTPSHTTANIMKMLVSDAILSVCMIFTVVRYMLVLLILCTECHEGDIRLLGGQTDREGTVELCFSGSWVSVCDIGWSTEEARVVCRSLGYPAIGTQIQ